jgi:hypothetical protein
VLYSPVTAVVSNSFELADSPFPILKKSWLMSRTKLDGAASASRAGALHTRIEDVPQGGPRAA